MTGLNAAPNRSAIDALKLKDGESLLELGCGPGLALRASLQSQPQTRAIGLDWSRTMLAQAARNNRRALSSGQINLVRGDFSKLPFAGDIVDAVLAVNVVYFMTSAAALREAHRVLRPGGRIVLYATDRSAMRHWPFARRHSHRLFDRSRLIGLLSDAGFTAKGIDVQTIDAGLGVKGLLAAASKATGESPIR